jgi:hypothetical protein
MGRFLRVHDRELDRVLDGQPPVGGDDLDVLAEFVSDVRRTFEVAPDAVTETRHLSAIVEAAAALPAGETSVVTPRQRSRRSRARSWTVKLVVAVILALGLFCGVAFAGVLPGPVQGAVAHVVRNVGLSVPGANDKDDGAQNERQQDRPATTPHGSQTATTGNDGTAGSQADQTGANEGHGRHENQSDDRQGSQQSGNNGTQHGNEQGTTGNSGPDQSNSSGQGTHGNVGPGEGEGRGNQGGQGSGSHGSGSQGSGSQGNGSQGNGDN